MDRQTFTLGRILGIPVGVDLSWLLIFALLTWLLAAGYYPDQFRTWPVALYWLAGALTAIVFFISVLLHELGHSLVARSYHIPVRKITLYIFGGISQIEDEPHNAREEFWVAIAGPAVSLVLAGFFFALGRIAPGGEFITALSRYLGVINLALGLFNLIPGFPLDGGRVFRAAVWAISKNMRRATLIASNLGRVVAFIFILLGVWQLFTGQLLNGLWIAFIGWFLESAATGQVQQQRIQDLLMGRKVSEAMSRAYTEISAETSLQELVDMHILGSGLRTFIVKQGDKPVGMVTLHRIREVDRNAWPQTSVAQVMIPIGEIKQVSPGTPLWEALGEMDRDGVNQLPVVEDHEIIGMLNRVDVISFIRTLQEVSRDGR
jgi:Zn-dependent protease